MYNFDELITRRGTNSLKWDSAGHADVLPMWVADMDFRTAPVLIEALRRRVEHGIFGYTQVPPTYYEAVAAWFARRHGWNLQPEWIMYTSGVVPALSAIIKALTVPGDKVIAQTPVYNCFFSSIRNNGCELLANPLRRENDTYRMDFDDLERKAADPRAKLLLLCNPHNPAGRVWTREELTRLNDICLRHGVRVVADEIHCELVFSGHTYTPFASVSTECLNNSITCVSPSKAFNIAGLQIASIISSDADIRARIERAININEVCDVNPFGVIATEAAYSAEGEEWLLQTCPNSPSPDWKGPTWSGWTAQPCTCLRKSWNTFSWRKHNSGSMPAPCMAPKAKVTCDGTLPARAAGCWKDWSGLRSSCRNRTTKSDRHSTRILSVPSRLTFFLSIT